MRVLFFSLVRQLPGEKETSVAEARSMRELLEQLSCRYGPSFRQELFPEGQVSSEHIVMVNGRHIAHLGGLETPLNASDVVTIFPLIAGG